MSLHYLVKLKSRISVKMPLMVNNHTVNNSTYFTLMIARRCVAIGLINVLWLQQTIKFVNIILTI